MTGRDAHPEAILPPGLDLHNLMFLLPYQNVSPSTKAFQLVASSLSRMIYAIDI